MLLASGSNPPHISAIKCRFAFFRTANNSVAGFAVYFHRWLSCCFSECSTVPRSQGNSISAHVCSFIRDFGSSSHPRLVSIHQPIHFYRVFFILGHNFFSSIVSYILKSLAVGFLIYTYGRPSPPKIQKYNWLVISLIVFWRTIDLILGDLFKIQMDKSSLAK